MSHRLLSVALCAGALAVLPSLAAAQFPPPPPPPGAPAPVQDRWPTPPGPSRPASPPQQKQQQRQTQQPPQPTTQAPVTPRRAAAPATALVCSGVFAKDSTHEKLAARYDSRNVTFSEVDGPEGSKLNATILYPNEPKRRLEVLWNDVDARSDTSLIVINGRSQWTAPKGLKLGLSLAALEKANGRPFKLSGFDQNGSASVISWEGGALSTLPGGCKVGMRLVANTKSTEDARSAVSGEKELLSNDAGLRAVKPTVAEILMGY